MVRPTIVSFIRRVNYFFYLQFRYLFDKLFYKIKLIYIHRKIDTKKWKEFIKSIQPLIEKLRLDPNRNILLSKADEILEHKFNLLGKNYFSQDLSGDNNSTYKQINWHYDPSSGYTFPKDVWYRFVRKRVPYGIDIKYPWELSRCQHFILLGEAYALTKDEKYAIEYRNQILDWINNNPVRYGPNWSYTMEVSIRIANWLVALLYFIYSSSLDDHFLLRLMASVQEHGYHIGNNLENLQAFTSNHYVANLSGLFILAVFCPWMKKSESWARFAKREIEKEIIKQTYDDGWDYEASTGYHRLVTEMFMYPFLIAEYLYNPFSNTYANRLRRMLTVISEVAKPNGTIPQIGDNDSGRFLVFNFEKNIDSLNVNNLLETGKKNSIIATISHKNRSISYPQTGRYLFKSNNIYLMIIAGPKGQAGNGGHAHNDVLSYVLNIGGEDILIDSGSYVYSANPKIRNQFRSIKSHNTLYWEGIEPCTLDKDLFQLVEEGNIDIHKCDFSYSKFDFSATYSYKNKFHKREVTYNNENKKITIIDSCSNRDAIIAFHFAPGINPVVNEDSFQVRNVKFSFSGISSIKIEPTQFSPGYGELRDNFSIKAFLSGKKSQHTIMVGKS